MYLYRLRLIFIVLFLLCSVPVLAQTPVSATPTPEQKPTTIGELLDANPNVPAPFLFLSKDLNVPFPSNLPPEIQKQLPEFQKKLRTSTLAALGEMIGAGKKFMKAGGVNVLAPLSMIVINTNPGKANIYAGLSAEDKLKLLIGSLTTAQWQRIGSEAGLGFADLSEEQRPLFDSIFPADIAIQKYTIVPHDPESDPNSLDRKYEDFSAQPNRQGLHIRLSRTAQFVWSNPKEEGIRYVKTADQIAPKVGTKHFEMPFESGNQDRRSAFGNVILEELPNHPKPSDVNYDAPVLNRMIALKGLKTVGDVVRRVAAETHLPFTADARVAALPLYIKGTEARAGDLLMAIVLSVTGTYRKVGDAPPNLVYHLTDDRQGIGARTMQLNRWANVADFQRKMRLEKAFAQASKQHPDRYLSYAPNDPLALPPAIAHAVEESWAKKRDGVGPEYTVSNLPPDLREAVIAAARQEQKQGNPVTTEKVHFDIGLHVDILVPGIGAVQSNEGNLFWGSLSEVALPPDNPTASGESKQPPPVTPLPTSLAHRIMLLAPKSPEETTKFVVSAAKHGFTEIWIQVPGSEAGVPLLKSAVRAGKTAHIRVGAAISLLRGETGEPDRTILNETGDEFTTRETAIDEAGAFQYAPFWRFGITADLKKMRGWKVANERRLTTELTALAKVPGLTGLVLRESAAPGYTGRVKNTDFAPEGGQMGYTVPMRLAFIRQYALDPIDLTEYPRHLLLSPEPPFFPVNESIHSVESDGKMVPETSFVSPLEAWFEFREKSNRTLLSHLYKSIKENAPKLPLYLDDRRSIYGDIITSWYGSWDMAEKVPVNNSPFSYEMGPAQSMAKKSSQTALLSKTLWWGGTDKPDAPVNFAHTANDVAGEAHKDKWDGMVMDLTLVPSADIGHLIEGLPAPSTELSQIGNRE